MGRNRCPAVTSKNPQEEQRNTVPSCPRRWGNRRCPARWVGVSEKLSVRCCGMDGSWDGCGHLAYKGPRCGRDRNCRKKKRRANMARKRCRKKNKYGCPKEKTFAEATEFCAKRGM